MVRRLLDWLFPPDNEYERYLQRIDAAVSRDRQLRSVDRLLTATLGRAPTARELWAASPPPALREESE